MDEKPSILIVDDEKEIRFSLELRLGQMGFRTRIAVNGQEAIDACRDEAPSAVVMDVQMPVMDGLTALGIIKDDPQLKSIPIIMLSASLPQRRSAMAAGARFYLVKPFSSAALFQAINTAMREDANTD